MLELEDFAKLQAAIERASSAEEVLRERAITREQWLEAERCWHDAFAKEIEEGSNVLAERYLAAYMGEPAAPAAPAPPVALPAPEALPAQRHVPSYMRMGGGVSALSTPQELRAMPVMPAPMAPIPPVAPTASDPVAAPRVSPTPMPGVVLGAQPLGSGAGFAASALATPSAQAPAATPPSARLGQTTEVATPKRTGPTMPFQTPKRPAPSTSEPSPVSSRRGNRAKNVEIPAHIAALKGTSARDGGTLGIDEKSQRPSSPPLPFQTPMADPNRSASSQKRLSVDQFAWIVATVESTPPEAMDAVLARMRMTRDQYAAMGQAWQVELARDPQLATQFAAALTTERAKRRGSP